MTSSGNEMRTTRCYHVLGTNLFIKLYKRITEFIQLMSNVIKVIKLTPELSRDHSFRHSEQVASSTSLILFMSRGPAGF